MPAAVAKTKRIAMTLKFSRRLRLLLKSISRPTPAPVESPAMMEPKPMAPER